MITNRDIAAAGLDEKILLAAYENAMRQTNSIGNAFKAVEDVALADRQELPFTFGELHEWAKANANITYRTPAFSDALKTLTVVDTAAEANKLTVEKENKILCQYGFGHWDIQNAFVEKMPKAFDSRYLIIFQSYLNELDRNLRLGIPVSFLGSNGSGKTNGMAALVRQIIRKYYDPGAGTDGRVKMSVMMTPCYSMIEDYIENALGEDNIYTVVKLLLIDDVDRDYTGHRRAAFQSIIGARSREQGKPFFLTTALDETELTELFPHVFSRLKTGIVLKTKDCDLRSLRK